MPLASRVAIALVAAISLVAAPDVVPATITVSGAGDSVAADGAVTLREALVSINAGADVNSDVTFTRSGTYGSSDAIRFAIGYGAQTISPTRALPVAVRDLVIDGTSQPGFSAQPIITIDGGGAGAGAGGLLIDATTTTTVSALNVQHFPASGVRVGTALDRIFADGYDGAAPPSPPAGGAVTAQDLVVTGNGGGGVLVSAGRLDVTGASQINGNSGGTPIAFGALVAPGAILTLTGAQGMPVQVNGNAGVGLLVLGNFSGAYVEVAANGVQGVWVDTTDAPAFVDGALGINAELAALDVHGNGTDPGAFPGGGITVLRTRTSTTAMSTVANTNVYLPERFVFRALNDAGRIHDNLGDGITLGGDPTPGTGLCANLPGGLACGAVDAVVADAYVYGNQEGIVIQEQDADQAATVPNLYGNWVTENAGSGLHVHTSQVGFDQNGNYINGNIIGHNAWPSPTCDTSVAQTAAQIWFDGSVAASATLVAACAAHNDSASACNADRANTCLWNEDIFNASLPDPCRPSYLLSTSNCSSGTNSVTGYGGSGNPDLVVGVLAWSGAWVNGINVSWKHAGNLFESSDWSSGLNAFFSDGPSGAEQTCAAALLECPTHP